MQRAQRRRRQRFHARFITARIQRQRMRAEKLPPRELARHRHHIVRVLREPRQLRFLLQLKRRRLELRREHRIRDDGQRSSKIRRQDFRRDAEAIVSRERIKRTADFLDKLSDLRRRALARILCK